MNWCDKRRGLRLSALLTLVATGAVLAFAPAEALAEKKEKKQKETKSEKAEKSGKEEKAEKRPSRRERRQQKSKELNFAELVPIPIGHGAEGIKVPQRDEEGRLQMNFEIGTAFREDEKSLKMENLKIETFDTLGNLDMVVEMPKSIMNMESRVLTSADPIQIQRRDFKIVGGNVTFETRTRFGTFKGPVRMLIFNRDF